MVKTQTEIQHGDTPAEHAEQQGKSHLVHHGCRNEERERDAQWHAGLHKANEQRHRRARAEGRYDTQACRHDIGDTFRTTGEQRARALRREVGIDHSHHEYDAGEEQQHFGCVVEKELQCSTEVAAAVHRQRATRASDSGARAVYKPSQVMSAKAMNRVGCWLGQRRIAVETALIGQNRSLFKRVSCRHPVQQTNDHSKGCSGRPGLPTHDQGSRYPGGRTDGSSGKYRRIVAGNLYGNARCDTAVSAGDRFPSRTPSQ